MSRLNHLDLTSATSMPLEPAIDRFRHADAASSHQDRVECHPDFEGKLVSSASADGLSVEQYRRLAGALLSMQLQRSLKTVVVSSAVPNEGKSLTAANLALTLSEGCGRRVLLMDTDFRRPCVHQMFGLPNRSGLAEFLNSTGPLPTVQLSPRLSVVPAGRPTTNPMAALTSQRMQALISELGAQFDFVLLDTTPVGLLPDAHLIANVADGVLFVIGANATPYPLVQRSIAELGPERILGIVLNRAATSILAGQKYYGKYYARPEV